MPRARGVVLAQWQPFPSCGRGESDSSSCSARRKHEATNATLSLWTIIRDEDWCVNFQGTSQGYHGFTPNGRSRLDLHNVTLGPCEVPEMGVCIRTVRLFLGKMRRLPSARQVLGLDGSRPANPIQHESRRETLVLVIFFSTFCGKYQHAGMRRSLG